MRLSAGSLVHKEAVFTGSVNRGRASGYLNKGPLLRILQHRHVCEWLHQNKAFARAMPLSGQELLFCPWIFLCKFSLEAHKKNLFLFLYFCILWFFFKMWILFRIKGTKLGVGETYVLILIHLLTGWVSLDNHMPSVFLNFLIHNERRMIIT